MTSTTKAYATTFGVILLIIILAGLYTWSVVQKQKMASDPSNPALLSLGTTGNQSPYTDLEGNPVSLSDFVGKTLVVKSWASWCPACVRELQELSTMSRQYESKGVKVIAINRAEPAKTAKAFLKSIGADQDVLLVLDPDDRYFESINGFNMPETVFYDTSGNIVHQQHGSLTSAEIRKYIEKTLKKSTEKTTQQ